MGYYKEITTLDRADLIKVIDDPTGSGGKETAISAANLASALSSINSPPTGNEFNNVNIVNMTTGGTINFPGTGGGLANGATLSMTFQASNTVLFNAPAAAMNVDINGSIPALKINGTKVLGVQGAAVANATDAASTQARLNDLLAELRTHGIIATT